MPKTTRARPPVSESAMTGFIRRHLDFLYGAARGAETATRLAALLDDHRDRPGARIRNESRSLTHADAILITYADQVREPNVAPLRTLGDFAERHLSDVVSGIHILPFHPSSSDDGFSVKDYFVVDATLGDWADVERLGSRFDLMFDAVFNHLSSQSEWFQRFLRDDPCFRDFFVAVEGRPDLSQVVRPRALPLLTEFPSVSGPRMIWTTFSPDQVDLNVRNPAVLLRLIDALLFYAGKGARFIRLDAIAYLWKEIGTPCIHLLQTHHLIQLLRAVLDEVAPHVMLITETNVPHLDNISYFGDGTNEAQLVYNFALPPLVLHTIATGDSEKLTAWAQSLELPSDRVALFNFLSSHDGIGLNPARGILSPAEIDALVDRALARGGFVSYKHNADGSKSPYELNLTYFDALSYPAAQEAIEIQIDRFLVAHAILLSLSGVPGIYFHSLFGSRNDRAGADAAGIPRRINRQKLDCAKLDRELADPNSLRARVFGGLKRLLRFRREHPAFSPAASQRVLSVNPSLFAVLRESADGSDCVLCLHNITDRTVEVRIETLRFDPCRLQPFETKWVALPHGSS